MVPAAGITMDGKLRRITKDGDFLYPVEQLSPTFRGKIMEKVKRMLRKRGDLRSYQSMIDKLWKNDWVVYCKTPMGNVQQIVQYLGRYSHRVAIDNSRLVDIDDSGVTFSYKDYKDGDKKKVMKLSGVEFLRRFAMHILPCRFVKIRYYGILGSRQKKAVKTLMARNRKKKKEDQVPTTETKMERIIRLTGFDPCRCPFCKKGIMHTIETLPRIRAPSVLFPNTKTTC